MQKFYKKVVQNKGYDGLDMVVIREKREEKRKGKGRFAINAKPNPYTTLITHHDTAIPLPGTKNIKAGEMRMRGELGKGVSDGLGEQSEPVPFFYSTTA